MYFPLPSFTGPISPLPDVNDRPVIQAPTSLSVNENVAVGTLIGTLAVSDEDPLDTVGHRRCHGQATAQGVGLAFVFIPVSKSILVSHVWPFVVVL